MHCLTHPSPLLRRQDASEDYGSGSDLSDMDINDAEDDDVQMLDEVGQRTSNLEQLREVSHGRQKRNTQSHTHTCNRFTVTMRRQTVFNSKGSCYLPHRTRTHTMA